MAGKLGIAIDLSLTLALGAYFVPLNQYSGGYVGLALGGEFFVGGTVAEFFSVSPFQFIGFSIAGGIGFTAALTAMGGYTWVF